MSDTPTDETPDTADETPENPETPEIDAASFEAKISQLENTISELTEELKAAKLVNYELLMAARQADHTPEPDSGDEDEEYETIDIEELFA